MINKQSHLLDKREEAITIGIKLSDKHVTVCLTDNKVVVSEEVHQVHSVDLLSVLAVNPTEGV